MTTLEGGTIGGPEFPLWVPDDDTPLIPLQAMFIAGQQSVLDSLTDLRKRMQSVQTIVDSSGTNVFDSATGWAKEDAKIHILGETYAYFYVQLKKVSSKVTVPADGNLTNLTLGQMTEAYWPLSQSHLGAGDAGRLAAAYVNPSGEVKLTAINSGYDIQVNDYLTFSGGWILQNPIPSS